MIEHRHDQPGHPNPGASVKWWHDEQLIHKKYPTAHEHILETREKGTTNGKRSTTARKDTRQDPEATRAKYELERI